MALQLKNKKDYTVNLGVKGGHMLSFPPNATLLLTDEVVDLFSETIAHYTEGNMLEIVGKSSKPSRVADGVSSPSTLKEKIVDTVEDILDDGKLNKSNKKKVSKKHR